MFDSLRSGDLDAPDLPIYVGTCREDEWRAVSTRMRRHGHGWFPVPTVNEHGEQERLILTTDPTIGVPRPESVALAMAEQELESLTLRPDETRHVRYAQDWRDIIDAHTVTPAEVEDDQPIEWIGAATNAETPAKIAKAAKRAGGMAGPIASAHDEAPETAPMWLAKIPAQTEWQFLGLIGFKTFAELTEERAIRRDRIEFEQAIRNSQRSRPAKAAA